MSKLRSDNGVYLTKGLFYEHNNRDAEWTLRPEDHKARSGKVYKSFYQIYMDSADEYEFVMKTLGNMAHWEKLCECKWFTGGMPLGPELKLRGLNDWREDMRLRDESIAKKQLLQAAKEGNTTAQKYLHEAAKKGKPGRPEKKQLQKKAPVSNLQDRFKKIQGGQG